MILDRLTNARHYEPLHAAFPAAMQFLQRPDLAQLPSGRCEIDGDRLYAMVVREPGRGRQGARLEAHRQYIDIQFCLAGADEIGWSPLGDCTPALDGEYDPARDLELFDDPPTAWSATPPGTFAIFFPHDAHAPLGGSGPLHKIVVKVAV